MLSSSAIIRKLHSAVMSGQLRPSQLQGTPEQLLEGAAFFVGLNGQRIISDEDIADQLTVVESTQDADYSIQFERIASARRQNSTKRSVVFLASSYQAHGGTEAFHQSLIPRVTERCNVVGFSATLHTEGDGSLLGVPYFKGAVAAKELMSLADTIVVWGIDDLRWFLPQSRPKVINVHHSDWASEWSNDLALKQLDVIDEIVCVNSDVSKKLRGMTDKPVHWIPNAVDTQRLLPSRKYLRLKSEHGIDPTSRVVLFGHRLAGEKQPCLAIEAAKYLPEGWTMVVAGDGELRAECERNAGSNVRVVGRVDTLADWLAVADRFISLATFEGYGYSVAEAIVAGVPVVGTAVGVLSQDGLARIVQSTDSAEAIANAITSPPVLPSVATDFLGMGQFVEMWSKVINNVRREDCDV